MLAILALTACARLNLTVGLAGTRSIGAGGFTDKQLAALNFLQFIMRGDKEFPTAADAASHTADYKWPAPWHNDHTQLGLKGLRYNVAFSAYAAAELAAAHTPAFPALAATILKDAFARLVHPDSWSYWDIPGKCGFPWSGLCEKANISMCEMNPELKHSSWCPDPVRYQNVMYSGHLAHVGALYEAISGDTSLSTKGWEFYGPPNERRGVGPIPYTMKKLLDAIHGQMKWSKSGGFACEPTVVYLVCNQHTYTASRLYDAITGPPSPGQPPYSSEKRKWLKYLNETAVRKKSHGPLGEGFFEILYQEQLREVGLPWVEIADIGGCAGNDGWAGVALGMWAADDAVHGGKDLLRRLRTSLAGNSAWQADKASGGAYLHQAHWPYETEGYTNEIATAWAPAALGGWGGTHASRVEDAFAYMEHEFGTPIDTDGDGVADGYYYNVDKKNGTHNDQMWSTGSLFMGMVRDDAIVTSLYDGSRPKQARLQPHLQEVVPGAPSALVRRAVFELDAAGAKRGTLKLKLTAGGAHALAGVKLSVAVPAGWEHEGGTKGPVLNTKVDVPADKDADVALVFVAV